MARFSEGGTQDLLAWAEGCGFATPSSAGGCQDFDTQQEKRPKSGAPSNAYRSHPRLATLQRMRKGGAPIFV